MEVLNDNAHLGALATFLIFPGVELQATFQEYWLALTHVLLEDFSLLTPRFAVNESRLFTIFAFLRPVLSVDGQSELAHRLTAGRVLEFRVAGEISNQHHFVEIRHRVAPSVVQGSIALRILRSHRAQCVHA